MPSVSKECETSMMQLEAIQRSLRLCIGYLEILSSALPARDDIAAREYMRVDTVNRRIRDTLVGASRAQVRHAEPALAAPPAGRPAATHRRRSCPATCRSRPSWPGKSISCARSCSTPRSRGISDVGGDPGFARPSFIYLSARHIGILTAGRSSRQPIRPRKHGPRLRVDACFCRDFAPARRDVLHPAHRPPGPPRQARRPFRAKISPCPNLPDSRYSHIPRNTIPPASIHGNSL